MWGPAAGLRRAKDDVTTEDWYARECTGVLPDLSGAQDRRVRRALPSPPAAAIRHRLRLRDSDDDRAGCRCAALRRGHVDHHR